MAVVGKVVVRLGEEEGNIILAQVRKDPVDRRDVGHCLLERVLAQAEQHQVFGLNRVEGIFRVQVQFNVVAVGRGRLRLVFMGKEVIDEGAIGFLDVADGFAQQRGRL
ncbi:hypothetical protein D3C77_655900 [compost metagenome]